MPTWVTDESGGALAGATDGTNRVFTTLQDMRTDRVIDVYVNGQRRAQELENGYQVTGSRTVQLNEAPVPEDTVAVSYCTDSIMPAVAEAYPKDLVTSSPTPLPLTARALDRPATMRVRLSCPSLELPPIEEVSESESARPSLDQPEGD